MEGTLGSKATGEPSMLMGCSVAFAIRNALKGAREELGIPGDDNIPGWVNLCMTSTALQSSRDISRAELYERSECIGIYAIKLGVLSSKYFGPERRKKMK